MKSKAWVRIAVLVGIALLLVALPILSACGAKEEKKPAPTTPAAKKVTIKLGGLVPLTGAAAEFGQIFSRAYDDFWRYYKEEVKTLPAGVEIDFKMYDFEYDPAKAVIAVKKMIEQDGVVAISGWGSTTDPATFPIQLKYQVPNATAMMMGPVAWPPTLRFSSDYTYNDEAKGQIRWFVEKYWKETKKETRAPKIALMYQDTPFGMGLVRPAKEYAKVIGAEIVAEVAIPMSPVDTKTELSKVKNAGADAILARHVATPYAQILKDEKALGMSIPLMGGIQAFNPVIQRLAEKEASGLIFAAYAYPDWLDEQDPEAGKPIRKLRELFVKYHPETPVEKDLLVWPSLGIYMVAWGTVANLAKALEVAATQVGPEKIDGPAMKKALESIKNFDLYLPGIKPLRNFSADDHRGIREMRILGFRDGQWKVVQDWIQVPELSPAEIRGEW